MYQALYRKYRPRSFSDVVGQEHITETLRRQVESGRTSHAYLFVGTRGTGKTTCAKILSRALNCEHPENGDPCNKCPSCLGIESGSILDVSEIDAASNNGVENIRAIRDEAIYSPSSVKKRVYIIDEVHMLSNAAFNALLKILEEPPEHLVFILATTELKKVPATILSRCQRFSFKRITPENISRRLKYVAEKEGFDLTDGAAALLSRLADGAMRDALSLLDQCVLSGTVDEKAVMDAVGLIGAGNTAFLWEHITGGDMTSALDHFEKLYFGGADPASVLSDLLSLVRDMMMMKVAPESGAALLSGTYSPEKLISLSAGLSAGRLVSISEALQEALSSMNTARDKRMAAEICLIKLTGLTSGALSEPAPVVFEAPAKKTAPAAPKATPQASPVKEAPPAPWEEAAPVREEVPPAPWEDIPPAPAPWETAAPQPIPQNTFEPTPWDDYEPPEDTINWGAPAAEEDDIAPTPSEQASEDEWWDKVLKICDSEIKGPAFTFLSDKFNLTPELSGANLILRTSNPFIINMIDLPEVRSSVSKAASSVLGKSISVSMTSEPAQQSLKTDKLDALARFGNIKFE